MRIWSCEMACEDVRGHCGNMHVGVDTVRPLVPIGPTICHPAAFIFHLSSFILEWKICISCTLCMLLFCHGGGHAICLSAHLTFLLLFARNR